MSAWAAPGVLPRANILYQSTDYAGSLRLLEQDTMPDTESNLLRGKNYFMMGDYKRATDFFEKAVAAAPTNSDYQLWLGRAWGRRAETGSWLTASSHASKARQCFEKAVALDPRNREAKNDLFTFYLNAPGLLGGGVEKAEAAAAGIAHERPAQYQSEEAEIADKRKDYAAAEAHLRRAVELAPSEPGRLLDLARYVAKRGRLKESDILFEQAHKMFPGRPGILFAEAKVNIDNNRNTERARKLLQEYVHANLTPDDPPRQEAERLLRRIGGSAE